MSNSGSPLYIGNNPLIAGPDEVDGDFTLIEGEQFYRIRNYPQIRPFFMTLVSSSDQWLFIGSNGGMTAGRKNPDNALFPYYTVDKVLESAALTGSKTILKVQSGKVRKLWEPFSRRYAGVYNLENNLYKNTAGSTLIFEEINRDLELKFCYQWSFSHRHGFVKKAWISNLADRDTKVEVLDGIQNLLPYGVNMHLQSNLSNLTDAYKKSELTENGMGIFSLSSMVVDKAEPSEALKATTVWTAGLPAQKHLLSSSQLDAYRRDYHLEDETLMKATKGAFFIDSTIALQPAETREWFTVAEINQGPAAVADLELSLRDSQALLGDLKADIHAGEQYLRKLVGLSDGLQLTADQLTTGRHFSNVLFNIMRGGVFSDINAIHTADLGHSIRQSNIELYRRHESFLGQLPERMELEELLAKAAKQEDPDLYRLTVEYLPLTFSRRHGDPSRPWNYFNIDPLQADGQPKFHYEGNWRDIFQNWEALAYSFPQFIKGMITRFLNASTIDGYNPYRISSEGIDWEVIEPDDPWSYIGYWGDHQIIYLQKLLEHAHAHFPGMLVQMLDDAYFVYACVPYRIKPYEAIVENPQDTIDFESGLQQDIAQRVEKTGSDGKLVFNHSGHIQHATMLEKLLVTTFTKLSNFVPEAGIWLNTQRPEWNDANNALVGNGVSMVTLYYLCRFLRFNRQLLKSANLDSLKVHREVADFYEEVSGVFEEQQSIIKKGCDATERRNITDQLGKAGSAYRAKAYRGFGEEKSAISIAGLMEKLAIIEDCLSASVARNIRKDGLYHAYNIIKFDGEKLQLSHLYEMLEGQVAALSTGKTAAGEALHLLDTLKASGMYRPDQYSYMLYPNRELPGFLRKNVVDHPVIEKSRLLPQLLENGDSRLVEKDAQGQYHFNGALHNAIDLEEVLHDLAAEGREELVRDEKAAWLEAFEQVFNHRDFTGRSGTFFSYEGLGSIYWHMVSKLLLAVQEHLTLPGLKEKEPETFGRLVEHYYEIKAGIGVDKSPDLYGAFPTDPYSHTPSHGGAKQPGMTGQVKEDILTRWAELGIKIEDGAIHFTPTFLRRSEFLEEEAELEYLNNKRETVRVKVEPHCLAFTYCGVLIVYRLGAKPQLAIESEAEAEKVIIESSRLPEDWSQRLFRRDAGLRRIEVVVDEKALL